MAAFKKVTRALGLGLWLLVTLSAGVGAREPAPLPGLGAGLSRSSMPGLSSGAFMTAMNWRLGRAAGRGVSGRQRQHDPIRRGPRQR